MENTNTLSEQVGFLLLSRQLTIAAAESCTGGLIGHLLTNISGSSAYYPGGVISYANEVKIELLKVPAEIIAAHGAVSEPVALQMARGVRDLLRTDIGLSVTGIAGPTGGTHEKPVGTTWIGIATPTEALAVHHLWTGDREANKQSSALAALQLVLDTLMLTAV